MTFKVDWGRTVSDLWRPLALLLRRLRSLWRRWIPWATIDRQIHEPQLAPETLRQERLPSSLVDWITQTVVNELEIGRRQGQIGGPGVHQLVERLFVAGPGAAHQVRQEAADKFLTACGRDVFLQVADGHAVEKVKFIRHGYWRIFRYSNEPRFEMASGPIGFQFPCRVVGHKLRHGIIGH